MKERPILFNGAMVKAILDGRKTQTRRPVDFKKIAKQGGCTNGKLAWSVAFESWAIFGGNSGADITPVMCPYGSIGDRLWVKETWQSGECAMNEPRGVVYRATDPDWETTEGWKWKPSIHMPRWASRITLEITDVRVQRVQEISQEDAKAEGVALSETVRGHKVYHSSYRAAFSSLWNQINGCDDWKKNIWGLGDRI